MSYDREFVGELTGTFLLELFGCCSVAVSVLFSAHQALCQVAMVWGVGVTLAIYATHNLSYAHLNPAVSLAMVLEAHVAWLVACICHGSDNGCVYGRRCPVWSFFWVQSSTTRLSTESSGDHRNRFDPPCFSGSIIQIPK